MGEAALPSGATMLQSRACVRVMAGLGTGRWLALDIRLYRDNTERGFTCSKWFSFSFQGLRSGGEVGLLGYSVCACVRVCVRACVCVLFLSQGHEVHGLQERQGKEKQQEPRSVLDQEAEAGTFLQFVCEDREWGGREKPQ